MAVLKRAGHLSKLIALIPPPIIVIIHSPPFSSGPLGSTADDTAGVSSPCHSETRFNHLPGWFCRNPLFNPDSITYYIWRLASRRQNIPRG